MQNNFPKIPLLLSMIFLVLFSFLFFFFYRTLYSNKAEAERKEILWQTEALRRDEIKQLEQSVKRLENERVALGTHFARSSDVVPFLDTIEALAGKAEARAEITSVDISKDGAGLLVGVKASGTFSGLYKFIALLENSPYKLKFMGMEIRKETGTGAEGKNIGSGRWDAIFRLKLLSFIP